MTGQRHGELTVLRKAPKTDRRTYWVCLCDCGQETTVVRENLIYGHTKTCGCAWRRKRYPREDLVGRTFGRLTVLAFAGRRKDGGGDSLWKCVCTCGKISTPHGYSLKCGGAQSCGCQIREGLLQFNITHGMSGTPEYRTWAAIHTRCYNKKEFNYPDYGGRGIKVCERWRGAHGFANFFTDMGVRPSKEHSLDRFPDNNGPYAPGNCRWATKEQQANNKRTTIWVELSGKRVSLKEACQAVGANYSTVIRRMWKGISFHDAVTKPLRPRNARQIAAKARAVGLKPQTVYARLRTGWTIEKALSVGVA